MSDGPVLRPPTRWWLIRHAAVETPSGMIVGSLDLPCAPIDPGMIDALACRLPTVSALVISDLQRCRQTADALRAAGAVFPVDPVIEPALREQNLGLWQGGNWNDPAFGNDPVAVSFWNDPVATRPPGGESFSDVVARVRIAMNDLNIAYEGKDILAVMHAGSIRAALAVALDVSPSAALRFGVDYLSLTRLTAYGDDAWSVDSVNG